MNEIDKAILDNYESFNQFSQELADHTQVVTSRLDDALARVDVRGKLSLILKESQNSKTAKDAFAWVGKLELMYDYFSSEEKTRADHIYEGVLRCASNRVRELATIPIEGVLALMADNSYKKFKESRI